MRYLIAIGLIASYFSKTSSFSRHGHAAFATLTTRSKVAANDKRLVHPLLLTSTLSEVNTTKTDYPSIKVPEGKGDAFPGATIINGKINTVSDEAEHKPMRPRSDPLVTSWEGIQDQLIKNFKLDPKDLKKYDEEMEDKDSLLEIYKAMQLARQFEVACNKQYMVSRFRKPQYFVAAMLLSYVNI